MPPISTVLVANRGEIARRIVRTARALGYRTVAVYSAADARAPHVRAADAAVRLGPAPAAESYLHIERIVGAARRAGADAIHPGYGFLSENPAFAEACAEAGLTFVGPPAAAIRTMGDKVAAKAVARRAGVPAIPGDEGPFDGPEDLARRAAAVGYPLLVKAAAGGGGRGIRRVETPDDLPGAVAAAEREARAAFGDGRVFLERLVPGARHVEVQVLADGHGNAVHLGERDCSVQRRHQKVVEEAPSPAVSPTLRKALGEAALAVARAVGYEGAGTVEFLLAEDGAFYFLEMNTRLQVEHPVTEAVYGVDLVAWQLRIAAGERLDPDVFPAEPTGHAIEARLYAEAPAAGFAPRAGTVVAFSPPRGPGLRCDAGIEDGTQVPPHYDPMLAKLVAFGPTRDEARRRLAAALRRTVVLGVGTNRAWLVRLLEHPTFAAGEATCAFLDSAAVEVPPPPASLRAAAAVLWLEGPEGRPPDGWRNRGRGRALLDLEIDGAPWAVRIDLEQDGTCIVDDGGDPLPVRIVERGDEARVEVDGVLLPVVSRWHGGALFVQSSEHTVRLAPHSRRSFESAGAAGGQVVAPAAGRVVAVHVREGEAAAAGAPAVTVESMKMETTLPVPVAGTVVRVAVRAGEAVAAGACLVEIRPDPSSSTSEPGAEPP